MFYEISSRIVFNKEREEALMNQAVKNGVEIALVCVLLLESRALTHAAGSPHNTCVHDEGSTPAQLGTRQLHPRQSKLPPQNKESLSTKKFLMAILAAISKHRESAKRPTPNPEPEETTLKKRSDSRTGKAPSPSNP